MGDKIMEMENKGIFPKFKIKDFVFFINYNTNKIFECQIDYIKIMVGTDYGSKYLTIEYGVTGKNIETYKNEIDLFKTKLEAEQMVKEMEEAKLNG